MGLTSRCLVLHASLRAVLRMQVQESLARQTTERHVGELETLLRAPCPKPSQRHEGPAPDAPQPKAPTSMPAGSPASRRPPPGTPQSLALEVADLRGRLFTLELAQQI